MERVKGIESYLLFRVFAFPCVNIRDFACRVFWSHAKKCIKTHFPSQELSGGFNPKQPGCTERTLVLHSPDAARPRSPTGSLRTKSPPCSARTAGRTRPFPSAPFAAATASRITRMLPLIPSAVNGRDRHQQRCALRLVKPQGRDAPHIGQVQQ